MTHSDFKLRSASISKNHTYVDERQDWLCKHYSNYSNHPIPIGPILPKNKMLPYYLAIIIQIIVQIWLIIVSLILLGNNWILGFSIIGVCFPGAIIALTTFFLSLSYIEKFWEGQR